MHPIPKLDPQSSRHARCLAPSRLLTQSKTNNGQPPRIPWFTRPTPRHETPRHRSRVPRPRHHPLALPRPARHHRRGADLWSRFFPTACALAEVPAPADSALDGTSLLPLFAGQALTLPRPLFWRYDFAPNRPQTLALRDSPWKIPADKMLGGRLNSTISRPTSAKNKTSLPGALTA